MIFVPDFFLVIKFIRFLKYFTEEQTKQYLYFYIDVNISIFKYFASCFHITSNKV